MLKNLFLQAVNSWVTSTAGVIVGLPEIWAGIGPMFADPAGSIDWKAVVTGIGILIVGLMARDWTKNVVPMTKGK